MTELLIGVKEIFTFQEREASKADKNESSNFTIINTFTLQPGSAD